MAAVPKLSPALPLFACGLLAALFRAPAPQPAAFVPPSPPLASPTPPPALEDMLPRVAPYQHAISLAELADGRLAAVWYAGAKESAPDVALWLSLRDGKGWSAPRRIMTAAQTQAATGAFTDHLGNPVLFVAGDRLHLFYVSVGIGGWAASSLNHAFSDDFGANWSAPRKLFASPFLNISTLSRGAPVALEEGGIGLPVYHELIDLRGEWLRLSPDGAILEKTRLPTPRPALQPSIAVFDARHALALLRDSGKGAGRIMAVETDNAGLSWRALPPLDIVNEDSFTALLRLRDGKLLLAANPAPGKKRNPLVLFQSQDGGRGWDELCVVAASASGQDDFAYPSLLETRDGAVHLAFSRNYADLVHRRSGPDLKGLCAP